LSETSAERADARVFFALVPDPGVQAALGELARDLAARTGGRAVADANIHLTLAFVGNVTASAIARLKAILATLPQREFTLALDSMGTWKHVEVAWVAPTTVPEALRALHAFLSAALGDAGFTVETRPFRPHLTLARRGRRPLAAFACAPIDWRVTGVSLMRSTSAEDGVRYRELARSAFAE
jgi:2'-5' RNA ligase